MRFRIPLIDGRYDIETCDKNWSGMEGDDRVRFCSECGMNVHNFSLLESNQKETLLANRGERLCAMTTWVPERLQGENSAPKLSRLARILVAVLASAGLASAACKQREMDPTLVTLADGGPPSVAATGRAPPTTADAPLKRWLAACEDNQRFMAGEVVPCADQIRDDLRDDRRLMDPFAREPRQK